MTTYESTDGSIVHIEFYSDDPDATQAFYEDTFAWEFEPVDDMPEYILWRAPNPPNGGLMATQEEEITPSTLFYISVTSLTDTRDAIEHANGEILLEEMEVPEMGIFTIFRDPGGVIMAAWEDQYEGDVPDDDWPQFTDEPDTGSIVHFELYSDNPNATQKFCETVFDWTFESIEDGEYVMAYPPTPPYGGVMKATDDMPAGVLPYILVADTAATVDVVTENNGVILTDPFDVEGWGIMAVYEAPGGLVHALWESTEPTTSDDHPEIEAAE